MIKQGMRVWIRNHEHYALKESERSATVTGLVRDIDDTVMVLVQPDNYPHELSFYENEMEELR